MSQKRCRHYAIRWSTTGGLSAGKHFFRIGFAVRIPIFRGVMSPKRGKFLLFIFLLISVVPGFSQSGQTAASYYIQGEDLLKKDDPEKAYPLLLKAVQLSKQEKDWNTYPKAVNSLALLSGEGDEAAQKEAFGYLFEAIQTLKNAPKDSTMVELYFNIAEFYSNHDEIEKSIQYYVQAKNIRSSLDGEWNSQVARCYHGLGDIYKYYKFDFYQAEKCYDKALLIREKIQFKKPKVLFRNYYSLATTNRSQHDYEKAVSYGEKALEMSKGISPLSEEEAYAMLANIYRDIGETKKAGAYYKNAIRLNKKTNDVANLAWYYQCSAESLASDSLYEDANRDFSMSYSIYTKHKMDNKPLFVNLLIMQLDVYNATGNDVQFDKKLKEIFRKLTALDQLKGRVPYWVYVILGGRQQKKEKYDSALYYYQKALTAAVPAFGTVKAEDNPPEEAIGTTLYIYEALAKKSLALRGKFNTSKDPVFLQKSIKSLRLAEKLLSMERNALDMESAKWKFLDANYDLYENILANLYDGSDLLPKDTIYNLAFRYFEQSKSRSLADALTQTEQSKQISHQDSLFQRHTELKREILNVQADISDALERKQPATEIATLRKKQVTADRNIQVCKMAIEERYPGYFNVRYGYQTPALADVQHIVKERNQVILEYFWGTDWVYGIGISGDEIMFKRIGKPDSIKLAINGVLSHLTKDHAAMDKRVFESFVTHTHGLHNTLLKPFESLTSGKLHIQIIPDGPIGQVPFEILTKKPVLATGDVNYRALEYMIKSYGIGYAYSSSMLIRKSRSVVRKPSLLAVGFTAGQKLRSGDPKLEEIMGAELELEALSKRFGSGKFLVGNEATEANFKTLSPDFDIIHLAIHGRGDIQKNFSSSLYFRSKYDSLDDGELHAYELYGLKLKAMMAVLTACESGLGKGYKGEGMISMASAFTYSGCENILMSLWKVNDQASTRLMDDFYSQLLEGKTIDDALRQAKLDYLDTADELTADPKVWAPLVAYGSLEQVFQKEKSWTYIVAGVCIVVALLLSFRYRKNIF